MIVLDASALLALIQDEAGADPVADTISSGAVMSGGPGPSLGGRCCLALTSRTPPHVTLTADRAWAELDLPLTVRLLR